jgi:DNA-binding NtrC family response regulator
MVTEKKLHIPQRTKMNGKQHIELSALKSCRTLIIEDNNYVREAFELTLRRTGLDATVLTTAEEALEIIHMRPFDVIISDYRLPGMDGLEFFIKAEPYTPDATKALISAYGFDEIALDAQSVGVNHFFIKPFQSMNCSCAYTSATPLQRIDCLQGHIFNMHRD